MSESGIAFSDEFNQALSERSRVWDDLDTARDDNNKIIGLGSKIKEVGNPEPLTALTQTAHPPEELHAILGNLEAELKRISKDEREIQSNNDQIAQIKKQIQNRWNVFIFGASVVILFVLYMLVQLFS